MIPVRDILSFPNHPFRITEDAQMEQLTQSIAEFGVLNPVIVRKTNEGFRMISGHRRKYACEVLEIEEIPALIRDLDDDMATILMVDSNLQREQLLPSEKAFAYRMKLEAMKRQGARNDLTSDQLGQKLTTRGEIAETTSDSSTQIQRFIRLTYLIPEFLQLVDVGKLAFTPAVALSYLSEQEQMSVKMTMEIEQITPSLSQALRLKELSANKKLSEDAIFAIMTEQKKPDAWNLSLPIERLSSYFPRNYTPKMMRETIFRLLIEWNKHRTSNG